MTASTFGLTVAISQPRFPAKSTGGRADHFPGAHALVSAIRRIGEVAVADLPEQVAEERFRGDIVELQRACLRRLEEALLFGGGQLRKRFATERFMAMSVHLGNADAQDIPQRQAALVAEFRGGFQEGPLHVPDCTARIGGLHVPIQKLGHAQLHGTRPDLVRRNQSIADCNDERPFARGEKPGLVGFVCGVRASGIPGTTAA